jgi:hypothetical protein
MVKRMFPAGTKLANIATNLPFVMAGLRAHGHYFANAAVQAVANAICRIVQTPWRSTAFRGLRRFRESASLFRMPLRIGHRWDAAHSVSDLRHETSSDRFPDHPPGWLRPPGTRADDVRPGLSGAKQRR